MGDRIGSPTFGSVPARPGYFSNRYVDPLVSVPEGHLMPGSPAVDQGTTDDVPPLDFEADDRLIDSAPDIGCDEM